MQSVVTSRFCALLVLETESGLRDKSSDIENEFTLLIRVFIRLNKPTFCSFLTKPLKVFLVLTVLSWSLFPFSLITLYKTTNEVSNTMATIKSNLNVLTNSRQKKEVCDLKIFS